MKKYLLLFIFGCSPALLFSTASFAEIYKWVDAEGKTHFGDDKEAATAVQTEATTPVVVEVEEPNAYVPTQPTQEEIRQRAKESKKNDPEKKELAPGENDESGPQ